jgi:hypothetical protein
MDGQRGLPACPGSAARVAREETIVALAISRYSYFKEVRIMLAKKTSKNQLTLPKEIAGRFPGIDLFDATVEDNRIILVPVQVKPIAASLESIRDKMERLGIAEKEVDEAVRWARKRQS